MPHGSLLFAVLFATSFAPQDDLGADCGLASVRVLLERAEEAGEVGEGDLPRAHDLVERLVTCLAAGAQEPLLEVGYETTVLLDGHAERGLQSASVPLLEGLAGAYQDAVSPEHPDRLHCLGTLKGWIGDRGAALGLYQEELEARELEAEPHDPRLTRVRWRVAELVSAKGDYAEARRLGEQVVTSLATRLRDDHPELMEAQVDLAGWHQALGDIDAASSLLSSVVMRAAEELPDTHELLLRARRELALTHLGSGRLSEARDLLEAVLAVQETWPPSRARDVLRTRHVLAGVLHAQGEYASSLQIITTVVSAYEELLPPGDARLTGARSGLATTLTALGELEQARALHEAVLDSYEATYPEGNLFLAHARETLATTLHELGDDEAARLLVQSALDAYGAALPPTHPRVLTARVKLAGTAFALGDVPGATEQMEAVVAAYEASRPADDDALLRARLNLAVCLYKAGEHGRATEMAGAVHDVFATRLPQGHPDRLAAQQVLAALLGAQGRWAEAEEHDRAIVASLAVRVAVDHPELLRARFQLLVTLLQSGKEDACRAVLPVWLDGTERRLGALMSVSAREARAVAAVHQERLWLPLALVSRWDDPATAKRAFEVAETLRHVSQPLGRAWARGEDDDTTALRDRRVQLTTAINDLVLGAAFSGGVAEEQLGAWLRERDAIDRELRAALVGRGLWADAIRVEAIAARLSQGEVAVAYLATRTPVPGVPVTSDSLVPTLLAHVVTSDGALHRVDLGGLAEVEALVARWRGLLGAPVLRGGSLAEDSEPAAGDALRRAVLDPVLEVTGDVTRLHVAADGALHLVPFDGLPRGQGRVGDACQVAMTPSFGQLVLPAPPASRPARLVAVGGPDFGRRGSADEPPSEQPGGHGRDSSLASTFSPLLQSRIEAETIGLLFREALAGEVTVLTGQEATESAVMASAPGARFVHVATHGWFAPDTVPSLADPGRGGSWLPWEPQEVVRGFAPLALCGLALAEANLAAGSLGSRTGILTADELAGLDLSDCELAVLSACETNVGLQRSGQGIQSLQTALHVAGARSTITSLWKVDDAVARRLMERFYTALWVDDAPVGEALWSAKQFLRDEGASVRDWAAWVLSGATE
jgi:CHAT domain-containing protein/tetratricopeptide (TPR) repeat protein